MSVDQIVVAAAINKRMVYHYFGSKQAIYQAALQEVYGRLEQVEFGALAGEGSATERLVRLLRKYFAFLDAHPEFTQFVLWENVQHGRHVEKIAHALSKNPFVRRFRATVEEGVVAGELRPDLDVTHLLIHCIGLCFIYHSNRFSLSQSLKLDLGDARIREAGLQHVLALVVDGVRPAAAGAGRG